MCNYVCLYFIKDEIECLYVILNVVKEIKDLNMNIRESLRKIGVVFFFIREVSL